MQATIHNEFLTLTVDTHGAEAVSLKKAPRPHPVPLDGQAARRHF